MCFMVISYSLSDTPFGEALIASTPQGICQLAFQNEVDDTEQLIRTRFPGAKIHQESEPIHEWAVQTFDYPPEGFTPERCPPLHLSGTEFQMAIWKVLLHLRRNRTYSYSEIADLAGRPKAVRAVASAIGANPVAWLVPCHLIIRSDGNIGGYRWGVERKRRMLASIPDR